MFRIFILLSFLHLTAKSQDASKAKASAQRIIGAFNTKDYSSIEKELFFVGRLILSKRQIAEQFQEITKTYGKLSIIQADSLSPTKYKATLQNQRDSSENIAFIFQLNKHSKITSLYFSEPQFALDTISNTSIEEVLKQKSTSFKGCIFLAQKNSTLVKSCQGFEKLSPRIPLNDTSLFDLASCSKMFTALGILKLYEDKKLSLNDDLTTFFPSLPYKNITIRNLLNHTSGLPDYMYLFHKKWDRKLVANNNDVIKMLSKHHPKVYFKAGESFSYSNTGYVLLASIIEKVSQKPYNEYLKESFFQPFGMNSTRTIQNSRDFQEINIASDYLLDMEAQSFTDLQNLKDYDYLNYLQNIVGDGGIYTNLQDIEQLVKAFNNNLLISDSLYKMATSATQLPSGKTIKYGFGLMLSENGIVHHGGTWGGFQHYFAYDSNSSTLVYLLSNTNYPFVGSFAGKLISAVYRKNKPTFKNPYND